jgi:trehalose/maltose transport system substrate-binding protein
MTNVPAGKNAQVATLGGFGLGISRSSRNPAEALQLVRFLVHQEIKLEEARSGHESHNGPELYDPTAISKTNRNSAGNGKQPMSGVVDRPSTVAGEKYEEVSRAYIQAVRSVLLGQSGAPEAAASLQQQLVRMTGLKPGPPSRNHIAKEKSLGRASGPAAGSTGASPHPDVK